MTDKLAEIAKKSLGDSTSYAVFTDKFDASLLNPMPRDIARKGHGIRGDEFKGFDLWTCHEATFLLDNGLPVAGTLRFVYPSSSEFMVESKSAKLYLNSFDMCRMGPTYATAIENYENQVKTDLQKTLKTEVKVKFFSAGAYANATPLKLLEDHKNLISEGTWDSVYAFPGAITTEHLQGMTFDDYKSERNHIEAIETGGIQKHAYFTNTLRSRCRHTKQKDTGLAAISYSSTKLISAPSILKQIISLREVNEFHEFCAEKLFVEINKHLNSNDHLNVTLLYSRRGSLDINPIRYKGHIPFSVQRAFDVGYLIEKAQGQ